MILRKQGFQTWMIFHGLNGKMKNLMILPVSSRLIIAMLHHLVVEINQATMGTHLTKAIGGNHPHLILMMLLNNLQIILVRDHCHQCCHRSYRRPLRAHHCSGMIHNHQLLQPMLLCKRNRMIKDRRLRWRLLGLGRLRRRHLAAAASGRLRLLLASAATAAPRHAHCKEAAQARARPPRPHGPCAICRARARPGPTSRRRESRSPPRYPSARNSRGWQATSQAAWEARWRSSGAHTRPNA